MVAMVDCPGAAQQDVDLYVGGLHSFKKIACHPLMLALTGNHGLSAIQVSNALKKANIANVLDDPGEDGGAGKSLI
jgi:hypothetical protein